MAAVQILAWTGAIAALIGILLGLAGVGVGRWWGTGRLTRGYAVAAGVGVLLLNLQVVLSMPQGVRLAAILASLFLSLAVIVRPRIRTQ